MTRAAGTTLLVVCASTALLQLQLAGPNVALPQGVALVGCVLTLVLVRQRDRLAQPAAAG